MGQALPFSEIDRYLSELNDVSGCIVDTQFLIATFYEAHPFYDDADFLFGKLVEYKVPVYANVTTRSEFIDIQRRIRSTEALMGMIVPGSKWRLTERVKLRLRQLKSWVDKQAAQENMPILRDTDVICQFDRLN